MVDLYVCHLDAHRAGDLLLKRKEGFLTYTREALPQPPKDRGSRPYLEMKSILGCRKNAPINTGWPLWSFCGGDSEPSPQLLYGPDKGELVAGVVMIDSVPSGPRFIAICHRGMFEIHTCCCVILYILFNASSGSYVHWACPQLAFVSYWLIICCALLILKVLNMV